MLIMGDINSDHETLRIPEPLSFCPWDLWLLGATKIATLGSAREDYKGFVPPGVANKMENYCNNTYKRFSLIDFYGILETCNGSHGLHNRKVYIIFQTSRNYNYYLL